MVSFLEAPVHLCNVHRFPRVLGPVKLVATKGVYMVRQSALRLPFMIGAIKQQYYRRGKADKNHGESGADRQQRNSDNSTHHPKQHSLQA